MKNVMEELAKAMHSQKMRTSRAEHQFEDFEAASLFCSKCKAAVSVRKKLLLVLPEGEKYDYLCTQCGSSIGSKVTKEEIPDQFLVK